MKIQVNESNRVAVVIALPKTIAEVVKEMRIDPVLTYFNGEGGGLYSVAALRMQFAPGCEEYEAIDALKAQGYDYIEYKVGE